LRQGNKEVVVGRYLIYAGRIATIIVRVRYV
jgi:hypothetical protein